MVVIYGTALRCREQERLVQHGVCPASPVTFRWDYRWSIGALFGFLFQVGGKGIDHDLRHGATFLVGGGL